MTSSLKLKITSTEDMETPGFVFNPSDEQLLGYYLPHKICGDESLVSAIAEIDNISDHEPWDLRRLAAMPSKDTWPFFTRPDRRYKKSGHYNRLTRDGFYKVTGKKREIKNKTTNEVIGFKRVLVFYIGRVRNPEKTNWTMHEYYPNSSNSDQRDFIICRLHQRPLKKTFRSAVNEGEPGPDSASEVKNPETEIVRPEIESQFWEDLLNSNEQDFHSPTVPQLEMHMVEGEGHSSVNFHSTNGLSDDCNVPSSRFGIGDQQDNTTDSAMCPAVQGSLHAVPDDSSLSESSGGLNIWDISDTEMANASSDCFFGTAPGDDDVGVWDHLFEDASAYFS